MAAPMVVCSSHTSTNSGVLRLLHSCVWKSKFFRHIEDHLEIKSDDQKEVTYQYFISLKLEDRPSVLSIHRVSSTCARFFEKCPQHTRLTHSRNTHKHTHTHTHTHMFTSAAEWRPLWETAEWRPEQPPFLFKIEHSHILWCFFTSRKCRSRGLNACRPSEFKSAKHSGVASGVDDVIVTS